MSVFKKKPICEECGKEEAVSFSFIEEDSATGEGQWKFCCECTSGQEAYYIQFDRFFSKPSAQVDWMAHMNEKTWMDWKNFMDMMKRLRDATDSYGSL